MFIGEWSLSTYPEYAPFTDRDRFWQLANQMVDALDQAHSGWTYWTWKISGDDSGI